MVAVRAEGSHGGGTEYFVRVCFVHGLNRRLPVGTCPWPLGAIVFAALRRCAILPMANGVSVGAMQAANGVIVVLTACLFIQPVCRVSSLAG